jgi:hypothetical protein
MRGRGLALDEDHAVWIVYDIRGWGAALGYYKGQDASAFLKGLIGLTAWSGRVSMAMLGRWIDGYLTDRWRGLAIFGVCLPGTPYSSSTLGAQLYSRHPELLH